MFKKKGHKFCYSVVLQGILVQAFFGISFSSAIEVGKAFEELRDSGENYEIIGTVCEQVARLEMQRRYAQREYQVTTGIRYFDQTRTIGELDLVVIDRFTNRAVLIGEVKCWHNLNGALRKAKEQRARFLGVLKSGKPVEFEGPEGKSFAWNQFVDSKEFISVSQNGGQSVGFDYELEGSLEELMDLRLRLIECQNQGLCKPFQKRK